MAAGRGQHQHKSKGTKQTDRVQHNIPIISESGKQDTRWPLWILQKALPNGTGNVPAAVTNLHPAPETRN